MAIGLCEGARGIGAMLERVSGHPRAVSILMGRARYGGSGEKNALQEVENAEEQRGVHWMRERERHLYLFSSLNDVEVVATTAPSYCLVLP